MWGRTDRLADQYAAPDGNAGHTNSDADSNQHAAPLNDPGVYTDSNRDTDGNTVCCRAIAKSE